MTCEACKTIPPVVAEGYTEKGEWEDVGGLKTYVTGPSTAKSAIVDIYDITGFASQTIQGADALAAALNMLVFVPDFLRGDYAKGEWYTNPTPETDKLRGELFSRVTAFGSYVQSVRKFVEEAEKKWEVERWAALGLCWGGKVVANASGSGTKFRVSGQVHPGYVSFLNGCEISIADEMALTDGYRLLSVEDAKKISIPHIILASKDEDASEVAKCKQSLEGKGNGVVETYDTFHGWMGAKADLGKAEDVEWYEKGYNQIASYFEEHLKT
ncbi:related to hydrolase related to dienelactone hydrolase [Rhynchosporium secalis]|uniref:Related to hydrolase related to dienelactone hydrolase n=1 Tax=Rhynchosporium secalis TaxID=38038 RepID=A0A1E1MDT6_RHYSE|nr:related to hydrolase related to dienelactone hydrolase [Rhynchosporium secalis]